MAYWLVKSVPSSYSWDQLKKDKQTAWEGVRNFAARNHLKAMKKGDEVFYYHSNEGTEIVGIDRGTEHDLLPETIKAGAVFTVVAGRGNNGIVVIHADNVIS